MVNLKSFGIMFYMVDPSDVAFDSLNQIPDFISRAVPFFIILIILEELVARIRGQSINNVRDLLCSLSCGLVQQIVCLSIKGLGIVPYCYIYEKYRLINTFPGNQWTLFITTMLCTDFIYYVFHRVAHCWHILWAGHGVHHSGERYNLSTALRQGVFQSFSSWAFYLPMALVGIPPTSFAVHTQFNTLYQFWIHTEMVDKLPWPLEGFLNTPSHHRLHHQPPGNCNYAGVLIIWDRLFGTFKDEAKGTVRGVYGLAKPANTFDPVYMNLLHIHRMLTVPSAGEETAFSVEGNDGGSKKSATTSTISSVGPGGLTWERFWRNLPLLFSRRAVHSWMPHPIDFIAGSIQLYSFMPKQRVALPLPANALNSSIRKDLNSREVSFLEGRDNREGRPFFQKPLVCIAALLVFLFGFVLGYALMIDGKTIAGSVCGAVGYLPPSCVGKDVCVTDSQYRCPDLLFPVLCVCACLALSLVARLISLNSQ